MNMRPCLVLALGCLILAGTGEFLADVPGRKFLRILTHTLHLCCARLRTNTIAPLATLQRSKAFRCRVPARLALTCGWLSAAAAEADRRSLQEKFIAAHNTAR